MQSSVVVNTKENRWPSKLLSLEISQCFRWRGFGSLATVCSFAGSSFEPCFAKMSLIFLHPVTVPIYIILSDRVLEISLPSFSV